MNQYMLCPECYGLDPTPKQVDPSIHSFNEMFEYFDDLFMGSRAEASQYTETIGLERLPFDECFIADTASSRCETAAQNKVRSIKEDIAEILKDPEPLSHIVRKITDEQGKRICRKLNGSVKEERREIDTAFMARDTAVKLRDYLVDFCGIDPVRLQIAPPRELDGLWVVPETWTAYKPGAREEGIRY